MKNCLLDCKLNWFREMLDNEYVALVMLFPGGKGTANMKKLVIQRSIDFIEVEDDRTEETKDRNQAGSS